MSKKKITQEEKLQQAKENLERIEKRIRPFTKISNLKENDTRGKWTASRHFHKESRKKITSNNIIS